MKWLHKLLKIQSSISASVPSRQYHLICQSHLFNCSTFLIANLILVSSIRWLILLSLIRILHSPLPQPSTLSFLVMGQLFPKQDTREPIPARMEYVFLSFSLVSNVYFSHVCYDWSCFVNTCPFSRPSLFLIESNVVSPVLSSTASLWTFLPVAFVVLIPNYSPISSYPLEFNPLFPTSFHLLFLSFSRESQGMVLQVC